MLPFHYQALAQLDISENDIIIGKLNTIIQAKELIIPSIQFGLQKIKLSIKEQAKIFSEAQFIIGSHRAGLANLVFARSNTKIIEINSPANHHTPFIQLARERNLQYKLYEPIFCKLSKKQIDIEGFKNSTKHI